MPEPRLLLGRYQLDELIGAGGTARVYAGHDNVLDRRVAVKLLDAAAANSSDPAGSKRFVREARSSARFSHPRAVAIYDAGNDGGDLFLVMEHVVGTSLAHVIADRAPMAEGEMVRIAVDVLEALGAAHAVGLIHRDVKPANILIERDGRAKLADFGIAQRFDEISTSLTVEGMVVGTRGYMAPERSRGEDAGPAADLFAVGAVMYEMATGQRPPAPDPASELGPNLDMVREGLSLELVSAVATALSARPGDRFDSASEMITAIDGRLPPTQLAVAERATDPETWPVAGVLPTATAPIDRSVSAPPTVVSPDTDALPGSAAAGSTVSMTPGVERPSSERHVSPWWVLAAVVGLLLVGLAIVAGTRGDGDGVASSDTTAPAAGIAPDTVAATVPADDPSDAAAPVVTEPIAATTTPPTSPPAVAELIPGFPATDDLQQFIDQLRSTKAAGRQSKRLGDGLRKVAESDKNIDKDIADLRKEIDGWLDKDQIDPTVAARANQFLDGL